MSDLWRSTRPPASPWVTATVAEVTRPGPRAVVLRLAVPGRAGHRPGQHYVLRLTAEDGYVAQRSYSTASAPADPLVELAVDVLPDGEVSGFLAEGVAVGDTLEVRGPIGGWFVWDGTTPALALGGGSGVVPLVSMLRHARRTGVADRLTLVAAARTRAELLYADELAAGGAHLVLSREDAPARAAGRLRAADVAPHVGGAGQVFVCGSAGFAESAGHLLVDAGVDPALVRVERFGPSG